MSNQDKKEIVLNLVYDDWDLEKNIPKPNRPKTNITPHPDDDRRWLTEMNMVSVLPSVKTVPRKLEDIIKYPDEVFFYYVWCRDTFFWDSFCKDRMPVDYEVIRMFNQNSNLYLLLMNECEFEPKDSLVSLERLIQTLKLDPNRIILVSNNEKLEDYKADLNISAQVYTTRTMLNAISDKDRVLNFKSDKDPGSFFLCHNRSPRIHRYGLLCLLKNYDLLGDINWSLVNGWYNNIEEEEEDYLQVLNPQKYHELSSEIEFFRSITMQKSKYEIDRIEFDDRDIQSIFFEPNTYENSYFNIVTESNFRNEDVHISEKSFKPFLYFQFPLILASYRHGYYFRKAYPDIDFFDDIINHDYDNIVNDRERLAAFVEEIKRINGKKDFFIEFYKKNKERFIKNREVLQSLNNIYDYNFFGYLDSLKVKKPTKNLNLVYDNWNEEQQFPNNPNCREVYTGFLMNIDSPLGPLHFPGDLVRRYPLGDIVNYPDRKFFYFIILTPNKMLYNLREGLLPMPEEVIDTVLKFPNFNIIMMNEHEYENFQTVKAIHEWAVELNINQKQLWIANNNIQLNDYKKRLKSDINFHVTSILRDQIALIMHKKMGTLDFKIDKEGAFFLCQNRRPRPHRYALLSLLKKNNIIDNVDWSLVNGWNAKNIHIVFYCNVLNDVDVVELQEEIDYFQNIEQKKNKYEEQFTWFDSKEETDSIIWGETYVRETFENSYFNIATETEFDSDVLHISEKSFKAFYVMQFPLILASPYHITEIKNHYDFDWFDDIIDHSYDTVLNHRDRLFQFVKEVKRINDNKEFFIEFYKNNKKRFIDNYKKSLKWANNQRDRDFLLGLCDLPPNGNTMENYTKKKLI